MLPQTDNPLFDSNALTIMVVDDQDPIRKAIKRLVQNMGFGEIIECFDGTEALKLLNVKPIDLIILDLYMRKTSGFKVLEHIRNRDIGSDIPIIVVTGESGKEEIVKVADLGAEDYVIKPFQLQDLEKKIVRVLNHFYSPSPLFKSLRQGDRFLLGGNTTSALQKYDEALAIDSKSVRAMHGKALAFEKLGNTEIAIKILTECVRLNPSFHKAHAALANIYMQQKQVHAAITSLRYELEINPRQVSRQINLAKLLLSIGDAENSIIHYREALKDDPKRLAAIMGMGQAYVSSNNLEKAFHYFRRARRHHPENTKILETAVYYARANHETKRAELFLKDEKTAHPERSDTYAVLARLLADQERLEEAIAVWKDLIERKPDELEALKGLATLHLRKADFETATSLLLKIEKLDNSADVHLLLGEAYLGLENEASAINHLHRALPELQKKGRVLYLLGKTHQKSRQFAKAVILFELAISAGGEYTACFDERQACLHSLRIRRTTRIAS